MVERTGDFIVDFWDSLKGPSELSISINIKAIELQDVQIFCESIQDGDKQDCFCGLIDEL